MVVIQYLIIVLVVGFILWYTHILWKHRRLYDLTEQLPGPKPLPLIGNALQFFGLSDPLNYVMSLLNDYQGVMKLSAGPLVGFITDRPEIVKTLYSHPEAITKPYFYLLLQPITKDGLFTCKAQKWRRHRKVLAPSFNQKILDTFVEVFFRKSAIFTEKLCSLSDHVDIDLYFETLKCNLDIICETALCVDMNTQGSNCQMADYLRTMLTIMNDRIFTVWYKFEWIWKLTPSYRKFNNNLKQWSEVIDKIIQKKLSPYNNSKDVTEFKKRYDDLTRVQKRRGILDLLIEDSSFTDQEMIDEIYTFILAGTETTGATFCCACLMLGMFPDIQQKVYEEVLGVVGADGEILPAHLKQLEYMERVLKETMRLFPIGPLMGRQPTADIKVGDITIPEGAFVMVAVINIHRNPKYWPNPLKFDPDRFLPDEIAKRQPCTYLPFSYGPRNCIGERYAMMNLKVMLSTVIRKVIFHTSYKSVEEIKVAMNVFLKIKDGLKLWVESRHT